MKPNPPTRTRSAEVKGNAGDSTRRRQQTRIAAYVIGVLVLYVTATTVYYSHFAGMFVPDMEVDESGRQRVRRRPERHRQKFNPSKPTTEVDAVLEGYLTLIDISIPPLGLQGVDMYKGITAKFCHIDWKLQQKVPSKVPMFVDLIRLSSMCDGTMITVDLGDMIHQARQYDITAQTKGEITVVQPTGVIFHESRCGSTLVANLLGGFSPDHTRMYSEPSAHFQALAACESNPCNPTLHNKLIQDVFYLTGRTIRKSQPQYVFYKISSLATMYIDKFTAAMPNVPWTYLYRDTVEVIQSHMIPSSIGGVIRNRSRPVCLRSQQLAQQPVTTLQIANSKNRDTQTMSSEEYCATHLAALSLSALQEHDRSDMGRFVNYNQLPDIVWAQMMPLDYDILVGQPEVERMQAISKMYSKDRSRTQDVQFEGDSQKKKEAASSDVVLAAQTFAGDIYARLEVLSGEP